jgi:hypothetical protein
MHTWKLIRGFEASVQDELQQVLDSHSDAEERLGAEIHPAARKQSFTPEGIADDDCKSKLSVDFSFSYQQ